MTAVGDSQDVSSRRVRVLTTIPEIDDVAASWHALWDKCRDERTPFLSFEWVRTWAVHYGGGRKLHIILVEDGGTLVGVMPLICSSYRIGPFGLKVLETAASDSRNLIALVAPGQTRAVAADVSEHLSVQALSYGVVLRVGLVPSEHPFLHEFAEALSRLSPGVICRRKLASFAPYVLLPETLEDFGQALGVRRRKVLGRAQRKVARMPGGVRMRRAGDDELPGAMEHLFGLHQARWASTGIRGLFHDERSRCFHRDVARECNRMGWLDLSEMQLNGTTVSTHFTLVLDGVAYFMRSGRDVAYADYDIGHLHDYLLLQEWIGAGLREADFLRGAEPYKFYWTRNYRIYHELLAVRGGALGGLRLSIVSAWLRLSRFLSVRHPPRELLAYMRMQRATKNELRRMGITLRA